MSGLGPATEFKKLTASGTVKATPGFVWGVMGIKASGSGDIVLRDGGSGGTIRAQIPVGNFNPGYPNWFMFPTPIRFTTDIYAELQGTPGSVSGVLYE